eukprot:scaffold114760_cov29-Tisochrysis_lutea.AAC.4
MPLFSARAQYLLAAELKDLANEWCVGVTRAGDEGAVELLTHRPLLHCRGQADGLRGRSIRALCEHARESDVRAANWSSGGGTGKSP